MPWFVYMVRCSDGTFYTGITTDVGRRLGEHNSNDRLAARYTRSRRPVVLAYTEGTVSRAAAARRERAVRRLPRREKERLAASWSQG
ncbi:MAG: GIY-YIG nuclease family protein [Deltaproteobacteria bacterium]